MAQRPTKDWRQFLEEQEAAVAAGSLDPGSEDAWALRCFPAAFTADVDAVLTLFERRIERVDLSSHHDVWVSIKDVVTALNSVSERWKLIETGEREELSQYIDDALTEAGADLDAVASRAGIDRSEMTDEWREW
ncbi:hypothetical protein QLQ12_02645 [Actinoplanes sp. NEAU-A12]|uniref:Uncharacterized protein n=1 Tax=Actinoplanes sandaracinus TaxID=3045177 RepID=A0ABT6WCL4_9ACTN|nr:hypothetical protein [Actinoplanes sandaracinus]MDI6097497.1 hypothetical protein [Actinoplanes sandaracinus]